MPSDYNSTFCRPSKGQMINGRSRQQDSKSEERTNLFVVLEKFFLCVHIFDLMLKFSKCE